MIELPADLPAEVLAAVEGCEVLSASYGARGVVTYELSSRDSWPRRVLRVADGADPFAVIAEVDHLDWVDRRVPCPKVVASEPRPGSGHAAVFALPVGRPILDAVAEGSLPARRAATLAGRALARIHDLPVSGCPFTSRVDVRTRSILRRVRSGLYDSAMFSPEFSDREPAALLEEARMRLDVIDEDVVVAHGDFTLECLLIDGDTISGIRDWVRLGVADRHVDLVPALASVENALGAAAVTEFLDAYALASVDPVKVEAYRRLAEFE